MLPRSIPLILILLTAVILGFRNYKELSPRYKWLVILLLSATINEFISRYFAYAYHNNSPVSHFYVLVQCALYAAIYSIQSSHPKRIQVIYTITTLFCVLNSIFLQPLHIFPSHSIQLFFAVTILVILFDFRRLLLSGSRTPLRYLPDFWMNIGGLLFFSTTFFIFSYINFSGTRTPEWCIYLIYATNIFVYGCYGLTFLLKRSRA